MTTYYKVLGNDRMPIHGGSGQWPETGVWRTVGGTLTPCNNAIHACRREDLVLWLGPTIWTLEFEDEPTVHAGNKVYGRKARLLERFTTWNARTARLFAADCAEHVLHLFEQQYPDDARPREAIAATRAFANGTISQEELAEAGNAAGDAAWATAWTAASCATAQAAQDAAWPGEDAVWVTAQAATQVAVWAMAEDAAGSAARGKVRTAARTKARAAERAWQTNRLFDYLEGVVS